MSKRGVITVISAPSGCGKNAVISEAKKLRDGFAYITSATTREIRGEEKEGVDYFYKTEEEFDKLLQSGEILEWDLYCGNRYGTLRSQIEEKIESGMDLMLDLTISGAVAVKKAFPDDTITVFLLPPSIEELRRRLQLRGRESQEQIEKRIETAINVEIPQVDKFDCIIVNDVLSTASEKLLAVIDAEKLKYKRNQGILDELGLKGEYI